MYQKALVGSTIRYIVGRNAVQTVYWRSKDTPKSKMLKVSKTFTFGSANKGTKSLPVQVQNEQSFRFE